MTEKESLYYKLRLIREAEKAIIREYPSNDIKTPCHLAIGAEAIAVGVTHVFPKAAIFGSYRNHHWYLASGGDLGNFFLELYGKENAIADGKAGSMHLSSPETGLMLTSAVVGTQIGPALGYALGKRLQGKEQIVICVLGDGATEEGVFHEALNVAALYELPVIFIVEDNDLAIHQKKKVRQSYDLKRLVESYGIAYYSDEATTVSKVIDKCNQVRKLPALLHFRYHRFYEHVGISEDYNAGYREKPIKQWDPLASEKRRPRLDLEIGNAINSAIEKARLAPTPPPEKLLEHVFQPA
jgi:TPP-dependent pyruvate/acetoin dehydrogenase alpha subunit